MNSVSIRNYGETLAVIKELKKLGFLKSSKPKKKKTVQDAQLKQESDLVGYAIDNIPSFRAINPDMSQSQIEDIQRRQAADFATLRDEVKQQRLEDINAQQGQRFSDITRFGSIFDRFFTSTPETPYDPLANLNPNTILLGDNDDWRDSVPDINENTFEGGINQGAPDIQTKLPTSVFPEEEEYFTIYPKRKETKRAETIAKLGIDKVPPLKGTSRAAFEEYYLGLANTTDRDVNNNLLSSKVAMFNEINRIIDEEGSSV
jgi:Fic family protein